MPAEIIPAVIPGTPAVKPEGQPAIVTEKITMTQADFDAKLQSEADKRVNQALATSKVKWDEDHVAAIATERAEAKRLALMSVTEREKELEKQRVTALDDRENKLNRRDIQITAINKLDAESLPVSFAEMLIGKTEAETLVNVGTFQKAWQKEIDAEVTKRLKGKTPIGVSTPGGEVDMNALIRGAGRK